MDSTVDTGIANLALTKLGAARILDINEDTKAARAVRAIWDTVRDGELRSHNWTFAIRRITVPALDETPAWGFDFAYAVPADCLRIVQVDETAPGVSLTDRRSTVESDYSIEGADDGARIYTSIAAPLKIRYVAKVEKTGLWDTSFKQAFAARLAMELCEELTQSAPKRQLAQAEYAAAIREAVRAGSIQRPPQISPDDTWILARL